MTKVLTRSCKEDYVSVCLLLGSCYMDVYTVYEEFSFWSNCVGLPKPLKEFFQFDQIP